MKKSTIACAFAIGLIGGYYFQKKWSPSLLSPEQALNNVKKRVQPRLNLDGTWIYQHTEEWDGNQVNQTVYRGGLTENQGNSLKHYDFIVDAETGSLLSLTLQD